MKCPQGRQSSIMLLHPPKPNQSNQSLIATLRFHRLPSITGVGLFLVPGILVAPLADNGPSIKMVFQEDEQQPKHDDES